MKTKLIVALLVAASASATAAALASGYGPAPLYRPAVGAPALQSGKSVRTVAAERDDVTGSEEPYGGAVSGLPQDSFFAH